MTVMLASLACFNYKSRRLLLLVRVRLRRWFRSPRPKGLPPDELRRCTQHVYFGAQLKRRYASTVSSRVHEFSEISTSKTLLIASAKRSAVSKRTRLPVDAISDLISKSRQRRSSGSARASRHKGRGPPSAQTTTNNQIQPRLRYASTAVFVVVDPVLGQGCWRHARFCLDASRVRLRVGAGK